MAQLVQIGILSQSSDLTMSDLLRLAAALQKQVSRDFEPVWGIRATVSAFSSIETKPTNYWPLVFVDSLGDPSLEGYHQFSNGQPMAVVRINQNWTHSASHECLEMIADPWGNSLRTSNSVRPGAEDQRVQYLVEVCDPCANRDYGYNVDDLLMCDFYTPDYFAPVAASSARYSFSGNVTAPRQVLPGGYLSFFDPADGVCYQLRWPYGAPSPVLVTIPSLSLNSQRFEGGNFRAAIDRLSPHEKGAGDVSGKSRVSSTTLSPVRGGKAQSVLYDAFLASLCKPGRRGTTRGRELRTPSRRRSR